MRGSQDGLFGVVGAKAWMVVVELHYEKVPR